jgi:hypothetical protein
MFLFK